MKIKFIATDKVVKKHDLMLLAAEANGTAQTGQHIDPRDDSTENNLTIKQMRGEVPLTPAQRKKFPFVINPDSHYTIRAGRVFDTNSPEDVAIMNLARIQDKIAESKKTFNRQKHCGYFENKELEAQLEVNDADNYYEAMSRVRGCTEDELKNVAMLLDYLIPEVIIDVKQMTIIIIRKLVYDLCKTHPAKVMECFGEDAKENIYVLSLVDKGILYRRENGFYDGTRYLGSSIQAVRDFMGKAESESARSRWATQLMQSKGKIADTRPAEDEAKELVRNAKADMVDGNLEDALTKATKAYKMMPSQEILDLKGKIQEQITEKTATTFDVNNLTPDQKKLYDELLKIEGDDLVNYAAVKRVSKSKAELKEMDAEDIRILILKKLS